MDELDDSSAQKTEQRNLKLQTQISLINFEQIFYIFLLMCILELKSSSVLNPGEIRDKYLKDKDINNKNLLTLYQEIAKDLNDSLMEFELKNFSISKVLFALLCLAWGEYGLYYQFCNVFGQDLLIGMRYIQSTYKIKSSKDNIAIPNKSSFYQAIQDKVKDVEISKFGVLE